MESQTRIEGNVGSASLSSFYTKIYWWMFVGMIVSAFSGYVALNTGAGQQALASLYSLGNMLSILYIGIMIGIQMIATRIPAEMSKAVFFAFAAFNGFMLSAFVASFSQQAVILAFSVTAFLFAGLALYGQTTNKDLSGWGPAIKIGMLGAVGASLLNLFVLGNGMLSTIISAVIVLVFSASIAYDNQRFKALYAQNSHDEELLDRQVSLGAIWMYISFVALFTNILSLMGIFGGDE